MNEALLNFKNRITGYWSGSTKKQKTIFFGILGLVALIIALTVFLTSRTTLVPLYSNLSPSETGNIKANLDGKGIQSQIADGGKTIMVPDDSVDTLKVELAAEGIPKSGSIDYSFFGQNAGMGMTENEFGVLKLDAMQTELSDLIKNIDGVDDAKVMITLPEKGVFVSDNEEQASASIVLNTKPGYQFEDSQIKALYHLVSKSVPNLPTDNIVIMNQNFEYFDLKSDSDTGAGATFATQQEVKKGIERDIQRQVQTMLGTLMGQNKVVVSVTADIDFTQEKREENLVTPVDKANMAGIAISAKRINETYTGKGAAGGVPSGSNPGDSLASNYVSGTDGNGDYERKEETINNEVNRIKKQIVESPYKVRDLGIQVMVEPPKPNKPSSLPQARVSDITKMLGTIVRTSIDKGANAQPLTNQDIANKISVTVQPFNGNTTFTQPAQASIPLWVYIAGGVLLLAVIILLILFIRSRRLAEYEEILEEEETIQNVPDLNDEIETEAGLKRKQLEKLAKEKPDEFAKLLRSWIAED
ncbi:flagellar basal-body MS-ring/collar protein FliF [Bacillus sp. MUM 13]|uniref:flagellar basal-body MS-ring/collar protein FliF n=1 Tax=Bacillus sp. MUM 13 TaxID=1678001 RepID=UPI0008F57C04|nr:flagellar basal-body MS-ring/collar protein FliF [Bacillus sp. MUM 13]OIK15279.1 flagellar M-ring protein FliF [Bacillus sp. MUM 13]